MPDRAQYFPPAARLTKRSQFISMSSQARRAGSRHFVVLWRANGLAFSRLGITVTRRVAGAVGRNRLKRLVREAFRTAGPSLPPGLDLVVIAKAGARALRGRQAAQELWRLWRSLDPDA
ncbi:MAG: ribonuclease P protein component [Desulfarculus sp.]|nr:MAG: ribonuclease P protein component [Desulfarculus sp.]